MNLIKTVNITNPRNVLVQIPSAIAGPWIQKFGQQLEVHYNEATDEITIKPHVLSRGGLA